MLKPLDYSIIIPCLNESRTIELAVYEALQAIKELGGKGEVVVADNLSTDDSSEKARAAGARVVSVPIKGYGAALHYGIKSCESKYVGFADADLSYPFVEIPKLFHRLESGEADFVLANRLNSDMQAGAMPLLNRYIGTLRLPQKSRPLVT